MDKIHNDLGITQNYQRHLIKASVSSNRGISDTKNLIKVYGKGADRIEILNKLQKESKFKIWWYSIFILIGAICLVLDPTSWFNVLDLYVVMINIDLVGRGKLIGIFVGILECFMYAFVCYGNALYGEVIKMLAICVPLNTYSIISWIKESKKKQNKTYDSTHKDDIVIKKLSKKQLPLYTALYIFMFGLSFVLLKYVLKQNTALILGTVSLSIMMLTKVLIAKKYMESWIIGIVGDLICTLMWGQTILEVGFSLSQVSMIAYYLACFTNDLYSYNLWKSMYRKVAVNGAVILAMRKVNIKRIIKLRHQYKNLHWDKKIDMNKNS